MNIRLMFEKLKTQFRALTGLTQRAGAGLYTEHQPQSQTFEELICAHEHRGVKVGRVSPLRAVWFDRDTPARRGLTRPTTLPVHWQRVKVATRRKYTADRHGVRPSPVAAISARTKAFGSPFAQFEIQTAATGDGRTPVVCNWSFGHSRGPLLAFALAVFLTSNVLAEEKPACCAKELPASEILSDKSLYQLDSIWTSDAASQSKLASLRGKPQIVTMFFAQCNYACPILVHDMKRIEAALPENLRDKVGFVLVSFDSERDTPEALATYRRVHGLKSNWRLLRGEPDDVLELGALLGIKFKKEPTGQFAHSNVITLLNAEGEIVSQQLGLNRDPAQIVSDAQKLFQVSTD